MYEFTIKLQTTKFDEEAANKLFEAGCDDALFSANASGIYLDFCRESTSLAEAILSALTDVKKAGFEAEVQEETTVHAQF